MRAAVAQSEAAIGPRPWRQYGAALALKQVTAFSYSAHAVSQSGRNLNDIALVFRALAAARMHSSPSVCFFRVRAADIADALRAKDLQEPGAWATGELYRQDGGRTGRKEGRIEEEGRNIGHAHTYASPARPVDDHQHLDRAGGFLARHWRSLESPSSLNSRLPSI